MFSLTIAFGDTPAMWRLLFKTEEAARNTCAFFGSAALGENAIHVTDDFGQSCYIHPKAVIALMLEDLDQSKQAGIEMQMHTWKMQAASQTRGAADPELRPLRGPPQGPSVFVPNGGGRMNG